MTKGKALIEARELLGPAANVGFWPNMSRPYSVSIRGIEFNGRNWEEALGYAKDSGHAQVWGDAKIAASNDIALAENSLKEARKKAAQGSLAKVVELTKSRFQKIRVRATGTGVCGGCGKVISANKNHCLACPPQLRPELPESRGFADPEGLVQS